MTGPLNTHQDKWKTYMLFTVFAERHGSWICRWLHV